METFYNFWLSMGLLSALYVLYRNSKSPRSTREHWFPALLFSLLFWPFFLGMAWEKKYIQEDYTKIRLGFTSLIQKIYLHIKFFRIK
jgi:hypothetical protein